MVARSVADPSAWSRAMILLGWAAGSAEPEETDSSEVEEAVDWAERLSTDLFLREEKKDITLPEGNERDSKGDVAVRSSTLTPLPTGKAAASALTLQPPLLSFA